ncbi:histidine utilization repressor [Nocardia puris]|uniref:Histidine utilization repressor n=1 Tax=Nocardia puris TaxID=208602 RepID=A0A366DB81_9NOCA|nr:histidine utilization repressor [Nocardia puris]MBF6213998.1 histidine utilization repressor [Nocardia puris]MBF6368705.1 histidine utilization repressor [Nocardia puris]MBF6461620.1 histidine utilization repressor [Nocardia puris]RBO86508.1 GntR family transcriptional regulator [Nocardia puris]
MPVVGIEVVDAELAALYGGLGTEVAAYERVKQLITSQIKGGRWQEGDQIPSENQLVSALGLSRMTINRALRDLTAEGVLNRVMGVGTFVAPTKKASPLFEVRNIADEISQRGHRHRTEVIFVRAEDADEAPPVLRNTVRGKVFHSLMVHFEDDVALQVEDRYVNPAEVPQYLEQDFTATTPNTYLSQVAPLVRGEHIVEAVLGSAEECRLLGIPESEPCLLIRRRTWSAGGLVSAARLVHPGSRNRLEGSFGTGD